MLMMPSGEHYVGQFQDGLMHGRGEWHRPADKGGDRRAGVWERGRNVEWLRAGVTRAATEEFLSRFREPSDYSSYFALAVVRKLPELPPGVDPADARVRAVLELLTHAAPAMAGVDASAAAEVELQALEAPLRAAQGALEHQQRRLRRAVLGAAAQREKVAKQNELLSAAEQLVADKEEDIRRYWQYEAEVRSRTHTRCAVCDGCARWRAGGAGTARRRHPTGNVRGGVLRVGQGTQH